MKSGLVVTKDISKTLIDSIDRLTQTDVLVGIPEKEDGRDDGAIGNAMIGFIAENGSPANNIPARPWLEPGIEEGKAAITKQFERGARLALEGKPIEPALHGAGLAGQNAARNKITTGPFAPLSPKTLKARKRKGRTGEKPLIDTGQFRRAVSYILRKNDA